MNYLLIFIVPLILYNTNKNSRQNFNGKPMISFVSLPSNLDWLCLFLVKVYSCEPEQSKI